MSGLYTDKAWAKAHEADEVVNFGHSVQYARGRVEELKSALRQHTGDAPAPVHVTVACHNGGCVYLTLGPKELVSLIKAELAAAEKHYRFLRILLAKVNKIIVPKKR
jgi:hypothetical protein